jgi:hypothetical protein
MLENRKTAIILEESDLIELERKVMDEEKNEALQFLKKVIGVDMTPEMLDRARQNAAKGDWVSTRFLGCFLFPGLLSCVVVPDT